MNTAVGDQLAQVSINSTSEEVRRNTVDDLSPEQLKKFPLIQLPRKSEEICCTGGFTTTIVFPLIQLPRKSEVVYTFKKKSKSTVSINSTSEEVRSKITQLEVLMITGKFPLIQLPRKSEVEAPSFDLFEEIVSINSTSEEVRSYSFTSAVKPK